MADQKRSKIVITGWHRSSLASPSKPSENHPSHPDSVSSPADFANKTDFPISVPAHQSDLSEYDKTPHMIYTARNDHYKIFQFYCPIFYLACTLECLTYSVEEYSGWTSVQCHPGRCLIIQPQTIYQYPANLARAWD